MSSYTPTDTYVQNYQKIGLRKKCPLCGDLLKTFSNFWTFARSIGCDIADEHWFVCHTESCRLKNTAFKDISKENK